MTPALGQMKVDLVVGIAVTLAFGQIKIALASGIALPPAPGQIKSAISMQTDPNHVNAQKTGGIILSLYFQWAFCPPASYI